MSTTIIVPLNHNEGVGKSNGFSVSSDRRKPNPTSASSYATNTMPMSMPAATMRDTNPAR